MTPVPTRLLAWPWPLVLLCAGFVIDVRSQAATPLSRELVEDRLAIERIYHAHRRGASRPFEEAVPRELIEGKVALHLKKRRILREVYGIQITESQLAEERRRIERHTRAPATLAEIEAALANDPVRFARSFIEPLVVDRVLRRCFARDTNLHGQVRGQADALRKALMAARTADRGSEKDLRELAAEHGASLRSVTWLLSPPRRARAPGVEGMDEDVRFGSADYSVEATVGPWTGPSREEPGHPAPGAVKDHPVPPAELLPVLVSRLREPGDISPVVESPASLAIYVARQREAATLSAFVLHLPKLSYDAWLSQTPPSEL